MKKNHFFGQFDKNFLMNGEKRSDEKNFLSKIGQKMVFFIFGVNLDFNDL